MLANSNESLVPNLVTTKGEQAISIKDSILKMLINQPYKVGYITYIPVYNRDLSLTFIFNYYPSNFLRREKESK